MRDIIYKVGDATAPTEQGLKIIAHICNNKGYWGKGFVNAVSGKWPQAKEKYREWYDNPDRKRLLMPDDVFNRVFRMGNVQFLELEPDIHLANMIAQDGIQSPNNRRPVSYNALGQCLELVATYALERKATVCMPRIGAGLGGGNWEDIEKLITEYVCNAGVQVTVYTLPGEEVPAVKMSR